jgi:branched-chain amino acid transport system substrate-binding protein
MVMMPCWVRRRRVLSTKVGVRLISGLMLVAALGCASPPPTPAAGGAKPGAGAAATAAPGGGKAFKLGVRTALTGPVAKQGQEVLHSVELAVDEWNAKGGVAGMKIEIVGVDDASNPGQAATVAEKLCSDNDVMGVVGSFQSATGIPASEVLAKCNLAYVAPGETNPQLTDRGLNNVNRVCPRDDDQGPAVAMYAQEALGAKKVFVLDDQSTGGKGGADEFDKKAKALGIQTQRGSIRVGDKDFRAVLSTIPKDVDAVGFFGFAPEGSLIAKQLQELGYKQPLMGIDPLYEPEDFIKASGGAAEGAVVSFVGPDIRKTPAAESFVKAFEEKWGPVSSYGPQAYEAANIILTGAQKVGSPDRVAIRDTVRQTKEYKGILGIPITFDAKGDVAGGTIFIFRVKDGAFVQDKMISTRA